MEVPDRGPVQVAGEGEVDRVVRGRRRDLPALRVQQPLAVRVPVDLELEPDPVEQALHRLGLRLGHRSGAAVCVARRDRRRPLLVVLEVVREVAVGVDAVADRDLAVVVVVAQVLAPQPLDVERVLVAVGVGHEDEPQLRRLEQPLDLGIVSPPAVDVPVHQAPVDLVSDPLACVLGGAVQHRRAAPVRDAARPRGEPEREQLAALVGRPELHELGDAAVVAGRRVHLVAEPAGLVPGAPDGEPVLGLLGCELLDGLASLDAGELGPDPVAPQLGALRLRRHELDLGAARHLADAGQLEPQSRQCRELLIADHCGVHVQLIVWTLRVAARHGDGKHERARRGHEQKSSHLRLLRGTRPRFRLPLLSRALRVAPYPQNRTDARYLRAQNAHARRHSLQEFLALASMRPRRGRAPVCRIAARRRSTAAAGARTSSATGGVSWRASWSCAGTRLLVCDHRAT